MRSFILRHHGHQFWIKKKFFNGRKRSFQCIRISLNSYKDWYHRLYFPLEIVGMVLYMSTHFQSYRVTNQYQNTIIIIFKQGKKQKAFIQNNLSGSCIIFEISADRQNNWVHDLRLSRLHKVWGQININWDNQNIISCLCKEFFIKNVHYCASFPFLLQRFS